MKITIEKTETVKTEVEIPLYFTTLQSWYYMVLPDGKILHVTENSASVSDADAALKYVMHYITPCSQEAFVEAYVKAINAISAASGIEHLPLICEPINKTENY